MTWFLQWTAPGAQTAEEADNVAVVKLYKSNSVIFKLFEKYRRVEFPIINISLFSLCVFEILFRFCSWLLWRNISEKMSSHLEKKYWKLAIQDYCNKILVSSPESGWDTRQRKLMRLLL